MSNGAINRSPRCAHRLFLSALCISAMNCLALYAQVSATLPELPRIDASQFGASIRKQVEMAHEKARLNPNDADACGRLGMILQTYEQYELARPCYERARRLAPREFRWPYYLGTVLAASGDHAGAVAVLKEALRLKADYLPAQLRLAEALLAASALDESQQVYEQIIKVTPDCARAHYGLGRVMAARRDPAAAAGHYRRACALYPGYGAAHYALALVYRDLDQTAQANAHLALYQKHKLDRPPLADPLLDEIAALNVGAAEHIRRGVQLEAAGQTERAIAEHERALEINPGLAQAHINLIRLYGSLGRVDMAQRHYRAAVEINPDLAESHYNFGVLLAGQGKFQEAAQAFRRSLEINPHYAEAHHNYGAMLEREGRLEDAARHYRAAIENRPDYRLAHFHLGRILVHQGQTAEAIQHLRQTLTPEDDETPRFMYALAAAYARAGDRLNALLYAREARKQAAARNQTALLALIDRDLRALEKEQ